MDFGVFVGRHFVSLSQDVSARVVAEKGLVFSDPFEFQPHPSGVLNAFVFVVPYFPLQQAEQLVKNQVVLFFYPDWVVELGALVLDV